ncbi:MAG: hypothetical protein A3H70_00175 [Candidatus Komeilibacteria bacterium RIFCSPLOWO2_02_FULL_48_11]|uniref:Poly A polymerase head domain-containing protein n=1 Tax=Candidatus Komeilibacteria bacterium RIFCSPLOWO2_02_FULL_48_11 TaxID=1798553 RepID=A0A1G2BQN9_9BACT|nr:MAG: hypothetical protein A3H70_00175 [Candidatus Komeilibacteria bacterium RIFCSPLOWO2_02_FULL_48_11]
MTPNFPKITAFPVLADLTEAFPNSGVYLVGGAVRDILLGKKITDIDLVVRHVTGEELENFLATRGQVVFAGKTFGVWKFHEIGKPKDEIYDIALPRTEFSLHKQGLYRDLKLKPIRACRLRMIWPAAILPSMPWLMICWPPD